MSAGTFTSGELLRIIAGIPQPDDLQCVPHVRQHFRTGAELMRRYARFRSETVGDGAALTELESAFGREFGIACMVISKTFPQTSADACAGAAWFRRELARRLREMAGAPAPWMEREE